MDDRTLPMSPDQVPPRAAAVPADALVVVDVVLTGPFKGRRYHLDAEGRRGARIEPDLTDAELQALVDLERQRRTGARPVDGVIDADRETGRPISTDAANRIRREAARAGAHNELLERRLLAEADAADAPPAPRVDRLTALELALDVARRDASRAGEADIDEALGELHATVVERRRRAARATAP